MWRPGPTVQICLGIISGVSLGIALKFWTNQPWTERQLMYLQFPGELFLRTVNCCILPLVISSIVSASSNLSQSGKTTSYIDFRSNTHVYIYIYTVTLIKIYYYFFLSNLHSILLKGNIGIHALFYYITTTTLGITLSVILSLTIKPGKWGTSSDESNVTDIQPQAHVRFVTVDTLLDLVR